MPLTDLKCRNAKASEKDYKLSDAGRLYLLVRKNGSKLWRMNYVFAGKQKTLSIGAYPEVSLADARTERDKAKEDLSRGKDPMLAEEVDPKRTFKAVAKKWFDARKSRWEPVYAERIWTRLEDRVFPKLGDKDVDKIDSTEALDVVHAIEVEKKFDLARRVKQYMSGVFRFAAAKGMTKFDPASVITEAMEAKPKTKHRNAIREKELVEFFRRLQNEKDTDPQTLLAVEFVVHTFVRTKEFRFARWEEFDFQERLWRIPEERMKMKREHLVPLSDRSIELLHKLKAIAGDSPWVVPSRLDSTDVISENTLLFCLYRLGYHSRATIHGFRSTASTILNEAEMWNYDAIERQLAHVPKDEVREAYNAALYLAERTRFMKWYSQLLTGKAKQAQIVKETLLDGLL